MAKKIKKAPGWLGLSEDRTSFVYIHERAEIVRQIFELSIAGFGGYTIAKFLNSKNVPAFGTSNRWDQSTIHNMLSNRATIGEYQRKQTIGDKEYPVGDPIPGYYPAVIDETLFQAAQEARRENLATRRGRRGRFITNLFAGLTTCFYCNNPVWFHSNGAAKSLICSTVQEGRGCFRRGWSYGDFERTFFEFTKQLAIDPSASEEEREALKDLIVQIGKLGGPDVYHLRVSIAVKLRELISELKIASAGIAPGHEKPNVAIRRDQPGRFFTVAINGFPARTVCFS